MTTVQKFIVDLQLQREKGIYHWLAFVQKFKKGGEFFYVHRNDDTLPTLNIQPHIVTATTYTDNTHNFLCSTKGAEVGNAGHVKDLFKNGSACFHDYVEAQTYTNMLSRFLEGRGVSKKVKVI